MFNGSLADGSWMTAPKDLLGIVKRKDKMHNNSTDTNVLYILNTIYAMHIFLHPFYFHATNNLAYVLSINASYLSPLSLF